ncbi:flagellar protein FlaG [Marinococcus luteus]|uniref:flagellar protein FlaG n=1 Tax=Marinococcus luteus TaxID=1122204 RepID=UPI000B87A65D|nr:flagellar protein FlaG [Marinococcus luteus]
MLDPHLTRLKFNVHEDTERVYVQVIDRDTEEIVREIPPESLLNFNASILRQSGLLVNEKG